MKAIFNRKTIQVEAFSVSWNDRAFHYGDGLFETMLAEGGKVKLLSYHWERIQEAAGILEYRLPDIFTLEYLNRSLLELCEKNELMNLARVKLLLWRKTGGRYEPMTDEVNFLMVVEKIKESPSPVVGHARVCQSIRNQVNLWSSFKSVSALSYVMAGMERKRKNVDDLIILDGRDHISEMLFSNIFWIKDGQFYTPDLKTGCINGVMRRYLIDRLGQDRHRLHEVFWKIEDLSDADHVFITNATGISPILRIEDYKFPPYAEIYELMP